MPRPLSDSMKAFSRALSAVSQVLGRTGLKTRVMNNLLATFCLHFTRTFLEMQVRGEIVFVGRENVKNIQNYAIVLGGKFPPLRP